MKKQQKIPKKYGLPIIFLIIAITAISIITQHLPAESKEQEQRIDSFLFAVGISLIGVLFMILKKAIDEKYLVDSLQILILVMVPFAAFIPILSDPKIFWYIFPAYYAAVIGWFLATDSRIIGKGEKNDKGEHERNDEQKAAASVIKRLFGMMMALSLFIFLMYWVGILPQVNQ